MHLHVSPQEFSENRILYKKVLVNGQDIFVFSNNPDDDLYQVNFLSVGNQQGDYILVNSSSISNPITVHVPGQVQFQDQVQVELQFFFVSILVRTSDF